MKMVSFDLILLAVVFLVYGAACIFGLILAFSRHKYEEIEERLGMKLADGPATALDISVFSLHNRLVEYNRVTGSLLVALSLLDIGGFTRIILNSPF